MLTRIEVGASPFSLAAEYEALAGLSKAGAVVSFIGSMRDINEGDEVVGLHLEHYPGMTQKVLSELVAEPDLSAVRIETYCRLKGQTGVEMEALTAASVAALTLYDMCKAVDKGMVVESLCLLEKRGGKSGDFQREETP